MVTTLLTSQILPDVQVFASSGTWHRPDTTLYKRARVICIGGGAGGTGGGSVDTVLAIGGGGGGGGGAKTILVFDLSQLGATESVTVGAGTNGTAGATWTSGSGSPVLPSAPGAGGNSSFGGWCIAEGGNAPGQSVSSPAAACQGMWDGGGQASLGDAVGAGGGAGGGSGNGTNAGSGGICIENPGARATVAAALGASGAAGPAGNTNGTVCGGGGAGGQGGNWSGSATDAGNGGNGGIPGGGGGGGGFLAGDTAGHPGGTGGNGAHGLVVVICT